MINQSQFFKVVRIRLKVLKMYFVIDERCKQKSLYWHTYKLNLKIILRSQYTLFLTYNNSLKFKIVNNSIKKKMNGI